MESKIFSIGDIVALKSHPYILENTEIIISGDHINLPPLMIVIEVGKSSYKAGKNRVETYLYTCTWFSSKSYDFETFDYYEDQLKLIQKGKLTVKLDELHRGSNLNFKTVPIELGKKKSTLSFDDGNLSSGAANNTINALLSYLPPVLQYIGQEEYKTKHPLKSKEDAIRLIPENSVKITYFNPFENSLTEKVLPIESLELIEEVSTNRLAGIQNIISKSGYLQLAVLKRKTIIKPKNIACRCGYYFLRGFDYVTNKTEEFELKASTKIKPIATPFEEQAPKFDIRSNPESATAKFITNEIIDTIKKAESTGNYIRIKYQNRNDQVSYRTIKNFSLETVKEDKIEVTYLIGFCLLRLEQRTFRTDRIQSIEILALLF